MARAKLAVEKSKLNELPWQLLKPTKCPICGSQMRGLGDALEDGLDDCEGGFDFCNPCWS